MTAPDLKPCPFCGGDKNVICKTDYDGRDAYAVSCRYHECHGAIFTLGYGYFADKAEAIAAWNTRAVDPTAADRIEHLKTDRDGWISNAYAALDWQRDAEYKLETAEAKLTKAVDALREIAGIANEPWSIARAVLAELEKTE